MPVTQTTMKTPRNNKGKPDRVEAGPSLAAIIQPHSGSFISKPIYLNICETYEAVMGWQDRIPRLFCDLCTCNVWLQKISKYWHKGHGNNKHILKATCSNLRGAWWEESGLLPVRGEERRGGSRKVNMHWGAARCSCRTVFLLISLLPEGYQYPSDAHKAHQANT